MPTNDASDERALVKREKQECQLPLRVDRWVVERLADSIFVSPDSMRSRELSREQQAGETSRAAGPVELQDPGDGGRRRPFRSAKRSASSRGLAAGVQIFQTALSRSGSSWY